MSGALETKSNAELVADWELKQDVILHKLGGKNEARCQELALATLKELIARGYVVKDWNGVSDDEWNGVKDEIAKSFTDLTADEIESATNLGANYFEHGHEFILAGTPLADRSVTKAP